MQGTGGTGLAQLAIGLAVFFLPSIVAIARTHPNGGAICTLNLLAGLPLAAAAVAGSGMAISGGAIGGVFATAALGQASLFAYAGWTAAFVWSVTMLTRSRGSHPGKSGTPGTGYR